MSKTTDDLEGLADDIPNRYAVGDLMETDPQRLVAILAIRAMGWTCYHDRGERALGDWPTGATGIVYHGRGGTIQCVRVWSYARAQSEAWNPLASMDDAFALVEAMRSNGYGWLLRDEGGLTDAMFHRHGESYSASEEEPGAAIVVAAARAVLAWTD